MKFPSHAALLFAVLSLGFQLKPAFAQTSSGSSAASSAQNPKTSAKSGDQADAKTSAASPRSDTDTAKNPPAVAGKVDSAPAPVVVPQGPALFKLLDTDKDGRVSSAEFIAYGKSADAGTTGSGKTSSGANARSDSASGSTAGNASAKSVAAQASRPAEKPAAKSESALPDTGIPISTSTRADKHTAEVFEILDIDHNKFLTQKELDALSGGAHQISQP